MNPHLAEAFRNGQLVRPQVTEPNLVHLVRALASLSGVSGFDYYPATRKLAEVIGPCHHLVFVLLDGLGMNLLSRLPANSFLVSHLARTIQAICPSTTACALTSVATGEWPAQHAVTGWFTHLPDYGLTATILPFSERYTQQPLAQRGLRVQSILPLPAFYPRMTHRPFTLLPAPIVNTEYASYSRGYTTGLGFSSIPNAVDQIISLVQSHAEPMHIHLYIPDVDGLCHKKGTRHPALISLVEHIDRELTRLADAIVPRARLVLTADHGLIDIAPENHMPIFDGDALLPLLHAPPSGDARMPLFHVRDGARQAFLDMFHQRFARNMDLLDIDEAEHLELFGPAPLSPVARRRFGNFIGIAHRPATLLYHPPQPPTAHTREPYVAQHAGLSREEMLVPLVIA